MFYVISSICNISATFLSFYLLSSFLLYLQRRFSENKIWETEENQTPPQTDSIEMVECYNDPQRNQQHQQLQQLQQQQQQQKTPKLNTLPTLSISVPSPSPPYEDEEKFL